MDKVILINKPAGMTSFDCVFQVKKILREKSVGHTGTLDVNATGLLVILCGKYTKYLPYCQHNFKKYIATLQLGNDTISKDIWGEVTNTKPIESVSDDLLDAAVKNRIGKQLQVPPMISSTKINGRKLMDYANKGESIEIQPKPIEVYDAVLLKQNPITIEFNVSSGTYVRNLCEDIAHDLNQCGAMSSLVRTQIGNVTLDQAISLDQLTVDYPGVDIDRVLDPSIASYPVKDPTFIYQGKCLYHKGNDSLLFVTYQNKVIAVYEKENESTYKCKRGLW